ncbi:MAG: gamma-glutamylcyclotransferase family protein [Bacillota bacterium]
MDTNVQDGSFRYYAAYGVNLSSSHMAKRCRGAVLVGTGRIDGHRLAFRGTEVTELPYDTPLPYAYWDPVNQVERLEIARADRNLRGWATVEPDPNSSVPVAVWGITPDQERVLAVDGEYRGSPAIYHQATVDVKLDDGDVLPTVTFIIDRELSLAHPQGPYYAIIRLGYREYGFELKYLHAALWSCAG